MSEESKKYDNSGILFRNTAKDPDDARDRDFSGSATIGGVEFWLSGWLKEGQKGKFLSLKFKVKEPAASTKKAKATVDFDDEILF